MSTSASCPTSEPAPKISARLHQLFVQAASVHKLLAQAKRDHQSGPNPRKMPRYSRDLPYPRHLHLGHRCGYQRRRLAPCALGRVTQKVDQQGHRIFPPHSATAPWGLLAAMIAILKRSNGRAHGHRRSYFTLTIHSVATDHHQAPPLALVRRQFLSKQGGCERGHRPYFPSQLSFHRTWRNSDKVPSGVKATTSQQTSSKSSSRTSTSSKSSTCICRCTSSSCRGKSRRTVSRHSERYTTRWLDRFSVA